MTSFHFLTDFLFFYAPLILAVCSSVYYLAVCCAAVLFRRDREEGNDFAPPVSILKPVRGIEPSFYASLASYFRQDYPAVEIVFGLSDPAGRDPARWTIAQLQRDFPRVAVKVVAVPDAAGVNPKMSKLQRMIEQAAHEILVVTDADVAVEPGFLRRVVRPLADERVGMVTCLYRGVPAKQFRSILEALGMSGDFAGQVLLARLVRGVRFALGAAMVTRKKQVAEIGGIAPWADFLADDYILGRKIAEAGYRIHLSPAVVETVLPHRPVLEMLRQQLRWARTIRACSPRGYPGLLLAFGVPLALLAWVMHPDSAPALAILVVVLFTRLLAAWVSGVLVCRDRVVAKYFWLLPLRDLLAFGVWVASFFGNEVVWRNARFRLEAGGKIKPA